MSTGQDAMVTDVFNYCADDKAGNATTAIFKSKKDLRQGADVRFRRDSFAADIVKLCP